MLELLPWLALKQIFNYADMDSCINLHEIVNIREEEWRKKIVKLYGKQPEELILKQFVSKNEILACINSGIDINAQNNYGHTALHNASLFGLHERVKLLIDRGAEINTKSENGFNALDLAYIYGNYKIVELLKEHGAITSRYTIKSE